MKVQASSLRRGSVVDIDGKLYVVLSAQNIHPGKGTPVTQLDMRRISDGVKVSERYRTTEQVERAFVDKSVALHPLQQKAPSHLRRGFLFLRDRRQQGSAQPPGTVIPAGCRPF